VSRPLCTVVIPTQGRPSLLATLESLRPEHHDGERAEVLVVANTHGPLLSDVAATCRAFGVTYLEHDAGYHDWGHPQYRYGYERATGSHILCLGDDDVSVEGAFPTIRAAIRESEPGPLLFRVELHPSPTRGDQAVPVVLWSDVGDLRRGRVTGQNLCCPNVAGRIGDWRDDFHHIAETIRLWEGRVTWRPELIARMY
jgi:hypothetical protein